MAMANPECCDWVSDEGGRHPKFAVHGGIDGGAKLYVIRAHYKGALVPGKLHIGHTHAYVPYGREEVPIFKYEVLTAPPASLSWVPASGGDVPENAIPGGNDADGGFIVGIFLGVTETYYIGRVIIKGTVTVGKVHESHGCCYVPYGGKEHSFTEYEVLVKNLYGQLLSTFFDA